MGLLSPENFTLRIEYGEAPEKGWRIKQHSFSRLWILFPGRTGSVILHSYDWTHAKSKIRDQRIGIARFERWMQKPENKSVSARIYDSETNVIIHRYKNGHKV